MEGLLGGELQGFYAAFLTKNSRIAFARVQSCNPAATGRDGCERLARDWTGARQSIDCIDVFDDPGVPSLHC
jgi:hypothetical protein